MEYQIIWFILWAVLWAVYFMLDGIDFGVAMLQPFVAKNDAERRVTLNSIGPVWDGNEVWLITAGGATFAAFPTTYALMFSYLYTALLLILFALIIRGVSLEFRGKSDSVSWKRGWDYAFVVGSFLPALLFGVAFGNIFRGLPMDATGYHGNLLSLLNPYGLLTGVLFVLLFVVHGGLYLSLRTRGDIRVRAQLLAFRLWFPLTAVAIIFLGTTAFATNLYDNYLKVPFLFVVPAVAVAALLAVGHFANRAAYGKAFIASCATIVMVTFTGVVGLFPNLIPSSIDPRYSLTIFNSSSSPYTLKIMTIVALIFVPFVIVYQIWTYRIFSERISAEDVAKDEHAY
ncbi:MAG TPA: cytochrome d ubiquinol oxidase subunit II [Dissulfurispiraceae bacterium]|nr:cytochrome d ubiquinol oxidase subunit II [Dissulfurispiraceae bacterium]